MKGVIFDIKRFSTHDGEGIRTTIFLKGCLLNCAWCQNPEGILLKRRPIFFESKCIKCGICIKKAKNSGVTLKNNLIKLDIKSNEDWKEIIESCPSEAIVMDSKIFSVDDAIKEVMKDEVFFKHGGGITLSGGEPLIQSEFSIELLKRFKKLNVNTAIETALNIDRDILKEALEYLDIIYADFKIFNEEAHRKYIGASNKKIKDNIEFLLKSHKKENVIIRTPMIPGITTSEDNIKNISKFISNIYEGVSYEILNYNPLAQGKYSLIDRDYCFKENPKLYSKAQMQYFGDIAKGNGIKKLIIES